MAIKPLQGEEQPSTVNVGKYPQINGQALAVILKMVQNGLESGDFRKYIEDSPYSSRIQQMSLQLVGEDLIVSSRKRTEEELKNPSNIFEEWINLEQSIDQLIANVDTRAQGVKLKADYLEKRQKALDVLTPLIEAQNFVSGVTDFLRENTTHDLFDKLMAYCSNAV